MESQSRIDDLRRRVQADPASIAFAQLAEECRRAGQFQEAIDVCRHGLARHPGYLSARVTLGRALLQAGQIDDAQRELEQVRSLDPENLASVRALAELHRKRGASQEALMFYRVALGLAPNDPELDRTVSELSRHVAQQTKDEQDARTSSLLSVLQQWLSAIHVSRAQRSP